MTPYALLVLMSYRVYVCPKQRQQLFLSNNMLNEKWLGIIKLNIINKKYLQYFLIRQQNKQLNCANLKHQTSKMWRIT